MKIEIKLEAQGHSLYVDGKKVLDQQGYAVCDQVADALVTDWYDRTSEIGELVEGIKQLT